MRGVSLFTIKAPSWVLKWYRSMAHVRGCVQIRFPEAVPRLFSAKARDLLRGSIAAAVGVTKLKVMIDKVRPPNLVKKDGLPPSLEVHFQVCSGPSTLRRTARNIQMCSLAFQYMMGFDCNLCRMSCCEFVHGILSGLEVF